MTATLTAAAATALGFGEPGTTVDQGAHSGVHAFGPVEVVVDTEHAGRKVVAYRQTIEQTFAASAKYGTPERTSSYTRGRVTVDGTYYCQVPAGTPAQVARKIAAKLDTDAADAAILPTVTRLIAAAKRADSLAEAGTVEVGTVAYVYAMGYMRRGVVTRLTGKGGAEVAYTTASSNGRVFRKVAKVAELRVDATDAPVVEAPAVEAAPVVAAEAPRTEVVTEVVEPAAEPGTLAELRELLAATRAAIEAATAAEQAAPAGSRERHLAGRARRRHGRKLAKLLGE